MDPVPVLVSVDELQNLIARHGTAGPALRLCDLRWSGGSPAARAAFEKGHLPGARFVDLDRDLSHAQPSGPGGRHPLNTPDELAAVLARLGIGPDTWVVVYDDGHGAFAARLWFQLRLHGHRRVSLLDGGLAAWSTAGLALVASEESAPPAPLRRLTVDESMLASPGEVEQLVRTRSAPATARPLLTDARAPERYRGEVEPLDPVPGHIPGAINVPFAQSLRSAQDPRFLPVAELKAHLMARGLIPGRPVIASCGSGVTGCHTLVALELTGLAPGRLYVGSYSDWVSDPSREVER